jgi:circadian clock protein KaiC
MILERISTGISGLDSLIEGGIPKGFTVLVAGNPGTGKTILTSHFLYDGLMKNQNGIYVSFSEADYSFYNNTDRLGMDFKEFQKQNKFSFLDFAAVTQHGIQDALEEVLATIKETNAKRVVIDSFTAILHSFGNLNEARIALHVVLGKMLRAQGVTTLVIGEVPSGINNIGSGFEEFVADGIIKLEHGIGNASPFTVKVIKMRTTLIDRQTHVGLINEHGLMILPIQPIELYNIISSTRVPTGVLGLDERIGGGLLEGSITAIIGDSGVGKTTFALEFLINGVVNGEPGLYLTLEETYEELKRSPVASKHNLDNLSRNGLVVLPSILENQSPDEILSELEKQIIKTRPKRLVIDSLSSFENYYQNEIYVITKRLVSLVHKYHLTVIITHQSNHLGELPQTNIPKLSSLFQNIILLKYVEDKFIMKRSLVILKLRSSKHDNSILEFVISEEGLKIIGSMHQSQETFSDINQPIYCESQKTEDQIAAHQRAATKKLLSEFDTDETKNLKTKIINRKNRKQKSKKLLGIDDKNHLIDEKHIKQK